MRDSRHGGRIGEGLLDQTRLVRASFGRCALEKGFDRLLDLSRMSQCVRIDLVHDIDVLVWIHRGDVFGSKGDDALGTMHPIDKLQSEGPWTVEILLLR